MYLRIYIHIYLLTRTFSTCFDL